METGPSKEKLAALEKRMKRLGILKSEIEEKFIKGGGRGGQKVNKSSSAVFLFHEKTGLSVKCRSSRSQHLNRFLALRRLVDKIEAGQKGLPEKEAARIEKIKKQKQRRKRRGKRRRSKAEKKAVETRIFHESILL